MGRRLESHHSLEPSAAPPARGWAAAPVPAQLPPGVPSLTGRRAELLALDRLVAPRSAGATVSLALVTGAAGVGKTGLALSWAHRARKRFRDGQLFADLRGSDAAAAVDPGVVLGGFLRALGVDDGHVPAGVDERAALYRSLLSGLRVLVVLDDAGSAEQVRPLLPAGPACRVVVTSRGRLPELVAHEGAAPVQLDVLGEEEAAELLAAMAAIAGVALDGPTAVRLAELCDRLPLALRVAVSRLAGRADRSAAGLVARLEDERRRLDHLDDGELAVRDSFRLDYLGLDPDTSRAFRRLGLLEAPDFAMWVLAALLGADVDEAEAALERLVEVRLVEVAGRDPAGQVRYRMRGLVRLYARERVLAEESERERSAAVARALGGLLALAEAVHRREFGGDHGIVHGGAPRWHFDADTAEHLLTDPLTWLEAERYQLAAGVRQAAEVGLTELCWDLAMTASTLYEARGLVEDWRVTVGVALEATRRAGDRRGEAAMLRVLGRLRAFERGNADAVTHARQAMALFEAEGDRQGYALALFDLARLDRERGRFNQALAAYTEAGEVLAEAGDRYVRAWALGGIGLIRQELGQLDEGARVLSQALALMRSVGSRRGEARLLGRLGQLLLEQGRVEWAAASFEEALRLARAHGDAPGEACVLLGLGEVRHAQGRHEEADADLAAAFRFAEQAGDRVVWARARLAMGWLERDRGQLDRAADHLGEAAAAFAAADAPRWQARSLEALGEVRSAAGDLAAAQAVWASALDLLGAGQAETAERIAGRLTSREEIPS